jgi:hypothetical protein
VQLDLAAVLFQDAADDCKPQTGPLFARRHVRLEPTEVADLALQTWNPNL